MMHWRAAGCFPLIHDPASRTLKDGRAGSQLAHVNDHGGGSHQSLTCCLYRSKQTIMLQPDVSTYCLIVVKSSSIKTVLHNSQWLSLSTSDTVTRLSVSEVAMVARRYGVSRAELLNMYPTLLEQSKQCSDQAHDSSKMYWQVKDGQDRRCLQLSPEVLCCKSTAPQRQS